MNLDAAGSCDRARQMIGRRPQADAAIVIEGVDDLAFENFRTNDGQERGRLGRPLIIAQCVLLGMPFTTFGVEFGGLLS